ncbi:chromate efflux transporter [Proteiniclasticum sp. SCR006]|uniref:Chromate efflux transporter n=1 Tax=Proteiniclasticum aestuarii TaxID=2817862 RepID=A0A939H841_9CLOT|nr:chromate efflux transporter [Proteiniclasticum aestuarii]MBO1266057.1 chromate efflux transporter [Proteiniclasticum aestuarii]
MKETSGRPLKKVDTKAFLKDVLICSLGAYGGPEAHYGVFTDQMVVKKKYITEEDLIELIALTGVLPGPSSTQTLVSIGYKMGGPKLALLTMLVWALPVVVVMTILSFLSQILAGWNLSQDGFRYIGPMAVAFIVMAAYRIGRKVVKDQLTFVLLLFGAVTTYFIREPWIYPLVLVLGGVVTVLASGEKDLWNRVKLDPPWKYLIAFSVFAAGSLILAWIFDNRILDIFESFYRYGYLVIGGGQVVVPLMYGELVEIHQYMTSQEFLTGFGLVQGLPGPMFSFSAYAGGMAARGSGAFTQVMGAAAGAIGIFLPGLLLIYFIYPVWEKLKKIKGIKASLKGITAVAGGLITTAAVVLMQRSGIEVDNMLVMLITLALLFWKKIPAPLIVLGVLIAGFVF